MESDSDNVISSDNHNMDIKMEIKEEPMCPNELLSEVKSEFEEFETVFTSSHNIEDSANFSGMCNKIEIKLLPCWTESSSTEIKQESEMPSAASADLDNEIKKTASCTDVQTGDVSADETTRLYTESMCRNSNSIFSFFASIDSSENNDHNYSRQPQTLEFEPNVFHSDLKDCCLVQNCDTPYMSEICKKKFIFEPTLCKVDKLHACEICNKSFLRISHLKQHKITHERKKRHICKICNESFIRASQLKRHLLAHEGKRPHVCEICNRGFTREFHMREHKLLHTGNSPHRCEICGKSYTQLRNLKVHKLAHEGKRPYVCEICNKSFVLETGLKNHKLTHEGTRPYMCDICQKCFAHITTLKDHILYHEGRREHSCEICKKSFIRLSDLKHHELTHEFKRSLKCDKCNKRFTYLSSLRRHKLTHELKRPLKCESCNKLFPNPSSLRRHKLTHRHRATHFKN